MRIVGGIYRHRIINYPDDAKHIRPTKDRVREAIFSALGDLSNMSASKGDKVGETSSLTSEGMILKSSHIVFNNCLLRGEELAKIIILNCQGLIGQWV